ncbi:hypothetical protein RN001_005028 [Aquatica leii]|uniref:Uncharacterized protein n=1 Tax=Aquatica leii TaxID=1421715 RepID=A0AAN7PC29_9COLE|nr:hypothetical protein RN001_005028 [Aquatica leii]
MKSTLLIFSTFLLVIVYGLLAGDKGGPCIQNDTKLIASCNAVCRRGTVPTARGICNEGLKCYRTPRLNYFKENFVHDECFKSFLNQNPILNTRASEAETLATANVSENDIMTTKAIFCAE